MADSPRVQMQRKQFAASFGPAIQLPQDGDAVPNRTGLPDRLKSGIESLSGMSLSDVKVQYNSSWPARLNAHAFARGTDIHIATGQERHLPHEAWHVVQQAQGRVKPTAQMHGAAINDNPALEREADVQGQRALQVGHTLPALAVQAGQPAHPPLVQRVSVALKDGRVSSVSGKGDRRLGGSLRSHEGDHTTAYVTFKEMVKNQAMGKTVPEAAKALLLALNSVAVFPGMQLQTADYLHDYIDEMRGELVDLEISKASEGPDNVKKLAVLMDKIIEIRNSVPLSSRNVSMSSGGHGEGYSNDLLSECESRLRTDGPKMRFSPDEICEAMWALFDYSPTDSVDNLVIANIILQHILSMKLTYPRLWDYLSDLGSKYYLHNYFRAKVMPARLGKIKDKHRLAAIMENVEAAVLKGANAIRMGAAKRYNEKVGYRYDSKGI